MRSCLEKLIINNDIKTYTSGSHFGKCNLIHIGKCDMTRRTMSRGGGQSGEQTSGLMGDRGKRGSAWRVIRTTIERDGGTVG
jgi:hypothetical protein